MFIDQYVLRLEVSMAHAILVAVLHSIQYLDEIPILVTYAFLYFLA
jgi:hypothetical protein